MATAALVVLGVHRAVEWACREPPNYTQVEDGLYLGGSVPAPPRAAAAVLNLCEVPDPYRAAEHRWEPTRDAAPAPSLDWLREQVGFIRDHRAAGRTVFVHCRNGVSRGGLVVAAYLMAQHGWSRDEALTFVRSRRDVVRPNPAFLRLLSEWEEAVRAVGESSP